MCKVLLRNDYWCKGLGFTQPKSAAYEKYKEIMKEKKRTAKLDKDLAEAEGDAQMDLIA